MRYAVVMAVLTLSSPRLPSSRAPLNDAACHNDQCDGIGSYNEFEYGQPVHDAHAGRHGDVYGCQDCHNNSKCSSSTSILSLAIAFTAFIFVVDEGDAVAVVLPGPPVSYTISGDTTMRRLNRQKPPPEMMAARVLGHVHEVASGGGNAPV